MNGVFMVFYGNNMMAQEKFSVYTISQNSLTSFNNIHQLLILRSSKPIISILRKGELI